MPVARPSKIERAGEGGLSDNQKRRSDENEKRH